MSTERDETAIVRLWLEDGVTVLPDRVLDAVLDQLPATHQRRAGWLARRFPFMNSNAVRVAVAGAVALVLVVLGSRFLVSPNAPGAVPTPSPTPAPREARADLGEASAGTYFISDKTQTPVRFTFTLPAGWSIDADAFIRKHADEPDKSLTFSSWIITDVYADACHWQDRPGLITAGTGWHDLKVALEGQGPGEAGGSSGVNPAARITLYPPTASQLATCDGGFMRRWPDPGPDETGGWPVLRAGETDVVYLFDVNGERVVIATARQAGASAADIAELEQIVASIRFDQ